MEWLKDALVARKQRELTEQLQSAGRSFVALAQDERVLASIPPAAAWTVLNGLQASLRGMEQALRAARQHDLPAEARQTFGELTYALNSVKDTVESYALPAAEKLYGFAPPGTRWEMRLVDKGGRSS